MKLWRTIPIVLLVAMMVITPVMHSSSAIWIEYVGRQTVDSYVPYFVLYDPPGDGSYSTFTEEMTLTSTTTLSMKAGISKAEGTWSESWTVDTSYSTPDDQRKHFVIAKYLRITWDVWYYETISRSWYVAEYVSHTDLGGISFPSFDDLDTYDMFVVDQTGTQGSYDYHIIVGSGGTVTQDYQYLWSSATQTWVGFEVAIYGIQFGAYVQIKSANSVEVSVSYTYHDDDTTLDFYAESNDDLWSGSSPWNVDGFVWFDE